MFLIGFNCIYSDSKTSFTSFTDYYLIGSGRWALHRSNIPIPSWACWPLAPSCSARSLQSLERCGLLWNIKHSQWYGIPWKIKCNLSWNTKCLFQCGLLCNIAISDIYIKAISSEILKFSIIWSPHKYKMFETMRQELWWFWGQLSGLAKWPT